MTASENESISNNTKEEDRKATVSIRSMRLSVWYDARRQAMEREMTMTQYISSLIEKDLSNKK
jgi:hypothetical protein